MNGLKEWISFLKEVAKNTAFKDNDELGTAPDYIKTINGKTDTTIKKYEENSGN